ncbi:hypothetical protein AB0H18_38215 [Streptomyces sp. NPDC020766]|uniref:WD40/YVTN/BNR-like repeat-containing protein n=1 Tax=Streptomyces sp. NPDC020766 TaxID=3155011 RepID=UPI0033DCBC8F
MGAALDAWFGTTGVSGGGRNPQVFHTRDGGRTWTVPKTALPGTATNIASLSFRNPRDGLAAGGDFDPSSNIDLGAVARTSDGGTSWALGGTPTGFKNGVTWIPGRRSTAIAAGPDGSDATTDGGRTWSRFDRTLLLGINCSAHARCRAVGKSGLAARLVLPRH